MKKTKMAVLAAGACTLAILAGCTPMHAQPLPVVSGPHASVTLYREGAYNAGAMPMIFGEADRDYVEIYNANFWKFDVAPGEHTFFVRSNQADQPFTLKSTLVADQSLCLTGYANPNNYLKALTGGIAYLLGNTFLLKEASCPTGEELKKYTQAGQ